MEILERDSLTHPSDICNDDTPFADSFGQILAFRNDAQRLASAALYELSTRFNLNIDPSSRIAKNAYLGVHLRTAADAMRVSLIS